MRKLLLFTIINTLAMVLLIASRLFSDDEGFDWIMTVAIVLIFANWIHYFVQRKRLKDSE